MTSKMCIVLRTWFVLLSPSLRQQMSQKFCIFLVAKNYRTPFWRPFYWRPGAYAPLCSLPASTVLATQSGASTWMMWTTAFCIQYFYDDDDVREWQGDACNHMVTLNCEAINYHFLSRFSQFMTKQSEQVQKRFISFYSCISYRTLRSQFAFGTM